MRNNQEIIDQIKMMFDAGITSGNSRMATSQRPVSSNDALERLLKEFQELMKEPNITNMTI
jgi:lipoate-protein ligase A